MKKTILLILSLFLLSGVSAQESTIDVTGFADKSVVPDEVIYNINVQVDDVDFSKTVDKLNEQMLALKNSFREAGIRDDQMKTMNYNVNENYIYNAGKRTPNGFRGTHSLIVKAPFDNLNVKNIYAAIKKSEVEVSFNISFGMSDPKIYQTELMTLAFEDAKIKAIHLASAAGGKLGKINSIVYGVQPIRSPMRNYNSKMMMDAASAPDINPGNLKVSDQVFVSFYIIQE